MVAVMDGSAHSVGTYTDVPADDEGEHMWLGGMTKAAQDKGVEVQYCMALAHQVMLPRTACHL